MQHSNSDNTKSKQILITGSAGLVGNHLLDQLSKAGHTITAIYRSEKPVINQPDFIKALQGDILDVVFLNEAMESMDEVYHCAALVSFNPKQAKSIIKTNVEGTGNVVNAAIEAGVKKFCYVSSVAALGEGTNPIDEDAKPEPDKLTGYYAQSKYLGEAEVWRGVGEGLASVIVNPSIILGSGDWTKGSSQMFQSAYNSFPWYADGENGFVDVQDVVKAMIMLMESPIENERFIVSAANMSFREIFNAMAMAFGKKLPTKKVTSMLAGIIWRVESYKSIWTGKEPLLTKETARSAMTKIQYNNTKLLEAFPEFAYTDIAETIKNTCSELSIKYQLT